MKVLVTGASGFIGRHVLARLAARGDSVFALSRSTPGEVPPGVTILNADIADKKSLSLIPDGIERVYHLAARITFDPLRLPDLLKINCDGTKNLLESVSPQARFVYVSSACTIGLSRSSGHVLSEDEPLDVSLAESNPYMKSKLAAEEAVFAYATRRHVCVVNPTTVYGPGDYSLNSGTLIKTVLSKPFLPAAPGGSNTVDVEDVADGILLAGEKGISGRRYILGGDNLTYKNIYRIIAESGRRKPVIIPLPAIVRYPAALAASVLGRVTGNRFLTAQIVNDMFYFKYFSSARAENELAWKRKHDFRSSVERALSFYRERGLL